MHLFDEGWNKLRETIFAYKKKLGVIPPNAKLTPWPEELKQWDTLSADEKKMFIRQVEVFAAYAAYTDHEIGRVIEANDGLGKLDNTLVIFISGDNGNSAEGTMFGTPNEVAAVQGVELPVAAQLKDFYDVWGSDLTYPHMAIPWTRAFSTLFSWTKLVASHFGGTRQGMAISWPDRIKDAGGIRWQFHHVIDVLPTDLEAAGIAQPEFVDGLKQKPIEGVSMLYTFDKENERAPSTQKTQYFEVAGDHAIYQDGWMASSKVIQAPWDNSGVAQSNPAGYPWELYDLQNDWTQYSDVAAEHPEKLKEIEALFWREAEKFQVLPLDAAKFTRLVAPRPNLTAGRSEFTYSGVMTGTPNGDAPNLLATSYNIKADVVIPPGGAEGMLVTQGGRFGGYGFYLLESKPVFTWNMLDLERVRWAGTEALTPGAHTLEYDFSYDGLGVGTLAFNSVSGLGRSGTGVLKVDGKVVETIKMPRTIPLTLQWDENFDVGADTLTGVNDSDYQPPFRFTGELKKLQAAAHKNPAEEEPGFVAENGVEPHFLGRSPKVGSNRIFCGDRDV